MWSYYNLFHNQIYTDEEGYEYIKLKNSWTELPIIEVYLKKGAWKQNDNDMFCLFEPNSDQEDINDFDPFAVVDEESNSIC